MLRGCIQGGEALILTVMVGALVWVFAGACVLAVCRDAATGDRRPSLDGQSSRTEERPLITYEGTRMPFLLGISAGTETPTPQGSRVRAPF